MRQKLKKIAKVKLAEGNIRDKEYIMGQKYNYSTQRLILWIEKVFTKYFDVPKHLGRIFAFIALIVLLIGCPGWFEKFIIVLVYPFILNWSLYWLSISIFRSKLMFIYIRVRFRLIGVHNIRI